jgi:hypothetical protein
MIGSCRCIPADRLEEDVSVSMSLRRSAAAAALLGLCLALSACTGTAAAPGGGARATSRASTPSASTSTGSAANTVVIDITIANRQVMPSGQKLNLSRGQTVIMHVTSDVDDEIHAHTGGEGYELEVNAGKPATGSFVVSDPGSFEIESHHLNKIIAILNVR